MSHFSTALSAALETLHQSQADFCRVTGLGQSPMSRYVRGTAESVGIAVVEKIVRALPAPQNAEVLAGYLRDEIPADMRGLIELRAAGARAAEDEPDPLPPKLDNELRSLLS